MVFSILASFLGSCLHFICGPMQTLVLNFAADSLGKKSSRYLKAADSLSRAVTNCFIRPNFPRFPQWLPFDIVPPHTDLDLSQTLQPYSSYFMTSRKFFTLLHSSLRCTKWARQRDWYMFCHEAAQLWGSWMSWWKVPLAGVTGDSSCLGHILAEAKLILTHEKAWKALVMLFSNLQLTHFHLTNSTAWILTSKVWHWTLWDQDLWSG